MGVIGWAISLVSLAAVFLIGKVVASWAGDSTLWTTVVVAVCVLLFVWFLRIARRMDHRADVAREPSNAHFVSSPRLVESASAEANGGFVAAA